jgi:hypothetical protein
MEEERLSRSARLVEERVGSIAQEIERALLVSLDGPNMLRSPAPSWITTGAGASEGPARLLAWLLRSGGRMAEHVPISSFLGEAPPSGDVCAVVSQCLSPNARLPLAHAKSYAEMLLLTTVGDVPDGICTIRHGPRDEEGLLLRVVGPAVANVIAMRFTGHEPPPDRSALADARRRAEAATGGLDPRALHDIVGLVAMGPDVALCDGLRHKMLEALGRVHPVWDLCGIVHGPLQSFYDRQATLVTLEREGASSELFERLASVLHPERHRVVRLPRDLLEWPGKGRDAPLYELGHPGLKPGAGKDRIG